MSKIESFEGNHFESTDPVLKRLFSRPTTSADIFGIDVSHFQGVVDFNKVKASGVSFVFIKATEGITLVDPMFATNWAAAKASGLPRGAYHLFRPLDASASQVDNFINAIGKLEVGDLPPVLDVEVPADWTTIALAQRTTIILSWLTAVEAKLGVKPIIYLNNSMANDILSNPTAFKDYLLWIAHYTSASVPTIPKPWTAWTFWQHDQAGVVAGVPEKVDLDRFAGSLADFQNLLVSVEPALKPNKETEKMDLSKGLKKIAAWRPLAQQAPPNSSPDDSYFQKLVTYIPADIIAAWVTLSGFITQSAATIPHWISWAVFGGLLVLIPFYVCYLKTVPPGLSSGKIFHWLTSCLAYVAWVFALGGPFATQSWYQPIYGSIILVFVTLIIPVLERFFVKAPPPPS